MINWRHIISQLADAADNRIDALKRRLDDRSGDEPICIVPYRGFGTPEGIYLKGRVLEDRGVRPASETDSVWRNLRNMYRRFESDEIPAARVLARFATTEREFTADEEGYFEVRLAPEHPPEPQLWHPVELALIEPRRARQDKVRAAGAVLIPPQSAQFGVISDIDDTVLRTDATSLLRMLRATFFGNAYTRLPFPGVAALYRALQSGVDGQFANPLFYVSSSPWNIYDMLEEFFAIQQIPAGPLMLRDWGFSSKEESPFRHRQHKLATIRRILDTYPALPFLLIGDSGQQDPEIYREIVRMYPKRILAIYIRSVSRTAERIAAIGALAEQVAAEGSALVLADNTLTAARHAAENGWIAHDELAVVAAAVAADTPGERAAFQPAVVIEDQQAVEHGAVEATLEAGEQPPPPIVVDGETDDQTQKA
jgi:phosphatidate phosphatase APP1